MLLNQLKITKTKLKGNKTVNIDLKIFISRIVRYTYYW